MFFAKAQGIETVYEADVAIAAKEVDQTTPIKLDPAGNVLLPTPTDDPLDPLNWSLLRKYICIVIACFYYFLLTYLVTAPVPSFFLLVAQLNATYTEILWSFAIPCFGLSVGPLLVGALADTYGRRPVMIGSTALAVLASGCTSIRGINFDSYLVARFFQGLGAAPAANVGLCIINDVSWEYERGHRVGLWVIAANLGVILGGVFGGFLATINQYWIAYHVTILFAVLLFFECVFLPETIYPRDAVVAFESLRSGVVEQKDYSLPFKRTTQLGYFSLKKIPEVPHPKPWQTIVQFCKMWSNANVVISVLAYIFCQYWWFNAFLTMEPVAYSNYKLQIQGLFFLGFLVGLVVAEVFCSGNLSDKIMVLMTKRNNQIRVPEMRLWLGYPAAVISSLGLVLWGFSVERQWHWFTGQVAFFLFAFGLQVGNTVLSTYIVDNHPQHAMEVITYYTVIINMSAFILPWWINLWVEKSGFALSFGIQAIICTFGLVPAYALLHLYGRRWWKPLQIPKEPTPTGESVIV